MAVAQDLLGAHLPLRAMLMVIGIEMAFNAFTWLRVLRAWPETNFELLGQLLVDLGTLTALLFLSGGTTNPFVSLYLPSLAIAAAVLPWRLMIWLAAFAVLSHLGLGFVSVPLQLDRPSELFDYYRVGMGVNFMISVGLIAWFVAVMSSALRQRDGALGDAQQRLLRDERAVALGVQAATIAHEMGTPLSTIAVLLEELREAAQADAGLAPYVSDLDVLEEQLTLCTSALARLRSRASQSACRSEPVADWFEPFVRHWRLRHPHVRFEPLGLPPADAVIADPVAAAQILTILLDNAARACHECVTLAVRHRGGEVEFEVGDDGPGIPAAVRETLGTLPVESAAGGHGVGLYLAFSAAQRLRGAIELMPARRRPDGRPGRGTRALLRLPVAADVVLR